MFSLLEHGADLRLHVNGHHVQVHVKPTETLLYTLRQQLGLTGAKPGCENGDCGACTVMVDNLPMKSCLMLTAEAVDHDITTVEGLNNRPLQDAFMDEWAFHCGYCTSGFLMAAQALIEAQPDADRERIVEWLRSNICRCTGYEEIGEAVVSVLANESGNGKDNE